METRITKEALSEILMNKDLPQEYDSLQLRDLLIEDFGIFGLPTRDSVIELLQIIRGRPVYDMGAGTGYLSYCLEKIALESFSFEFRRGITAIDNYKTKFSSLNGTLKKAYQWHNVLIQDALTIAKHIKKSVVIMNWPDLDSDFAYSLAKNLHESNELIYIGEPDGGCNANDRFFDTVKLELLDVPWYTWDGLHDRCYRVHFRN